MYEDLRKEIKETRKNNDKLTDDQKNRLIAAIKSGDYDEVSTPSAADICRVP